MDLRAITPQFRKHIDGLVKLRRIPNSHRILVTHPDLANDLGRGYAEFWEPDPVWVAKQKRRTIYTDLKYHILATQLLCAKPRTFMGHWDFHSDDLAELLEAFADYLADNDRGAANRRMFGC